MRIYAIILLLSILHIKAGGLPIPIDEEKL